MGVDRQTNENGNLKYLYVVAPHMCMYGSDRDGMQV